MKRPKLLAALPLIFAAACAAPEGNNQTAAESTADNEAIANGMETTAAPSATGGGAAATLATADGAARGSATISESADGLTVQVTAEGLTAGEHGWHIHTVGKCEGPKFETAGAHWNPTSKQHGRDNPQGSHSGDMANLTAGADGRATASATVSGQTLASLLDADGAALLIHAKPDDYRTDPSGASGDRIACGVIERR